ncbi:HD domain-containing phosphohydrolase [Aliikangiella sp. IMCC44359]|uniref:HD domain-containing phosphohydrolase n=1 Tax=Aliikangiella sp. IMCC44359 TaxID=3459125 RepID=UPI00403A9269
MNDELIFADEPIAPQPHKSQLLDKYKILIVDDEPEVHAVTELSLSGFKFKNKELDFINAYSANDAKQLLQKHKDIAVILLDVVMETEHAGLDLVSHIRQEMNYSAVRIILRTGQPGQAPEREVIENFDINDYKCKTELTSQKLFTLMHASLRSYSDIVSLEQSKKGLRKVIDASRGIFNKHAFDSFISGAITQVAYLLDLDDAFIMSDETHIFRIEGEKFDKFFFVDQLGQISSIALSDLSQDVQKSVTLAIEKKTNIFTENSVLVYCENRYYITIFYFRPSRRLSSVDEELLNIFTENIVVALENIRLQEIIKENQKEIIYRLGEVVENRSKETGNHVKRVALYSELLAKLYPLDSEQTEIIKLASPLHDIGKIAIPDAILNKADTLDPKEWNVMKSHAERGGDMLDSSDLILLQAGAIIAGHHHEKWDGSGYPEGLSGEDIHIFGRITALADVFDALGSKRCYKEAWRDDEILEFLEKESGRHFEPKLVEIMLNNIDRFFKIRDELPDHS